MSFNSLALAGMFFTISITWEGTSKSHEKVSQRPMGHSPVTLPSLSQPHPELHWALPVTSLQKKIRPRLDLYVILYTMQALTKSGQLRHHDTLWGHAWRTLVRKNPPSGKNIKHCIWLLILHERKSEQMYNDMLTHGLWPMVYLDSQGKHPWKEYSCKTGDKEDWGRGT